MARVYKDAATTGPRRALPSLDLLRSAFAYDPESGILFWRTRPDLPNNWNARFAGQPSGRVSDQGYLIVSLGGMSYYTHRIIWKLLTGCDPNGDIDHRDTNKQNNRPGNLRDATAGQNNSNSRRSKSKNTGNPYRGVHWIGTTWQAMIAHKGHQKHIGCFKDPVLAAIAYDSKATELHGDFAVLNFPPPYSDRAKVLRHAILAAGPRG